MAVLDDGGRVRAAGGVVRRDGPGGVEVVVIHRPPPHDDWSFPKGHVEPAESDEDAALREVREESGMSCRLGPELGSTDYVDRRGRSKRVRYWLMEPIDGAVEAAPDDEVDEVRWVPIGDLAALLSYDLDRAMMASVSPSFTSRSPRSVPLDTEEP